ncbi:MAG: nuclear transport factor 2 family protein [Janthinobacterium lividum]
MMLSRLLTGSTLAALSFGFILPISADPTQDTRAAIASAYTNMNKALARRDSAAYLVYLHPAYSAIFADGKEVHGKDKAAAPLRQMFALANTVTASTQILTCSLQNDGAVVTTQETMSLTSKATGKPLVIKTVDNVRSFWLKVNGRWLLKQERLLSETTTINGVESKPPE